MSRHNGSAIDPVPRLYLTHNSYVVRDLACRTNKRVSLGLTCSKRYVWFLWESSRYLNDLYPYSVANPFQEFSKWLSSTSMIYHSAFGPRPNLPGSTNPPQVSVSQKNYTGWLFEPWPVRFNRWGPTENGRALCIPRQYWRLTPSQPQHDPPGSHWFGALTTVGNCRELWRLLGSSRSIYHADFMHVNITNFRLLIRLYVKV